jgi:hypothetical protein
MPGPFAIMDEKSATKTKEKWFEIFNKEDQIFTIIQLQIEGSNKLKIMSRGS